ncbi:HEAT repeat-containing protein 3 [Cataglyphis hispanica]|uniref:HEAT repeat-containing protein 3 n=1 Tax=Cataglyphis hispanica TaxID=1086592 RepID=UPI00217F8EA7|nr:HEAT repeat-containing protein 3 [Cataglyphis hispanica]
MGKQKRQRHKSHKENPTGLPSVKEFELNEEFMEGAREKVLQNAYGDVQSCHLEEKLSALQILASMSCDSSMAKQIAKDGIAKIIGPLLMDHNAAIRANTAQTLRDIAENGGEDAYTDLIKDDIMTPLIALLKEYSDWEPKKTGDEKETFVQAVDLLRILCANNESALKCVNDEDLALLLTKFLDINIYGMEIVTITIQCMICLSDENDTAIKKIKEIESILFNLLDLKTDDEKTASKVLALRTCVANLLININNYADSNQIHVFCKVLSVLSEVLAVDHRQALSCLTSILPHENNAVSNDKRKKIYESKKMLELQEQALQILANLCYEDEDSEIDSDIDTSEIMEIVESECLDDDSMDDNLKMTSTFPVELVEIVNNGNLIDKIWDKTVLIVDKDVQEILNQTAEGKDIVKQSHDIRCAAYLCLNNLLPNIEIEVFGGVDNLYRKWLEIGTVIFKDVTSNDIELLEAATAAMRAILQQLAEVRANVFKQLTIDDVQPMLNGARQCSNVSVRVNLIRMLCNLVQILMNNKNSEDHEMIKFISTFLLNICTTETQAWVMAESIDALMDIYAEDETDCLAAEIELVPKLLSLIPHFKSKVRQQKKQLKDSMSVVSTVNANLTRFIKYKQKQIRNLRQKS